MQKIQKKNIHYNILYCNSRMVNFDRTSKRCESKQTTCLRNQLEIDKINNKHSEPSQGNKDINCVGMNSNGLK